MLKRFFILYQTIEREAEILKNWVIPFETCAWCYLWIDINTFSAFVTTVGGKPRPFVSCEISHFLSSSSGIENFENVEMTRSLCSNVSHPNHMRKRYA